MRHKQHSKEGEWPGEGEWKGSRRGMEDEEEEMGRKGEGEAGRGRD